MPARQLEPRVGTAAQGRSGRKIAGRVETRGRRGRMRTKTKLREKLNFIKLSFIEGVRLNGVTVMAMCRSNHALSHAPYELTCRGLGFHTHGFEFHNEGLYSTAPPREQHGFH